LVGLVLRGFVRVPAAVVKLEQLIVVLPVLLFLIGIYWMFKDFPAVSGLYSALSISLILWILICENIARSLLERPRLAALDS
jgi:hypothetical protein